MRQLTIDNVLSLSTDKYLTRKECGVRLSREGAAQSDPKKGL